jgi:hypothetical protein
MSKNLAFESGMRGRESSHKYHQAQNHEVPENKPEGKQDEAQVGGVKEATPLAFLSGMRGGEKFGVQPNPLESDEQSENHDEAIKGLPPGAEVIGGDATHHIVRIPKGK